MSNACYPHQGKHVARLTHCRKLLVGSQPQNHAVCQSQQESRISESISSSAFSYKCGESAKSSSADSENWSMVDKVYQRTYPSMTPSTKVSSLSALKQTVASTEAVTYDGGGSARNRLTDFLQTYSEPFAIRSQKMRNYKAHPGSICCWFGPTIFKKWTESGDELFVTPPRWSAYGLRLTFRSPILYLRTLNLEIFVQREAKKFEKFSIHWGLSFPNIIPKGAPVMELARAGDTKGVITMFEERRAGCRDTTLDGLSLLHVCQPRHNDRGDANVIRLLHGRVTLS